MDASIRPIREDLLNAPAPASVPIRRKAATVQAAPAAVLDVAVLAPCYNEALTIAGVVTGFQRQLPAARVYVYDNNSSDDTAAAAAAAGAIVRKAPLQGKGNVVRRMFSDIEADIYVLVDGDGTYDPAAVGQLIDRLVQDDLDMVCGARVSTSTEAYRLGHTTGNRVLTGLVREIFGRQFTDMLTGYRVFSRRFVKSFPSNSTGFEIETEFTVHALQMRLPTDEIETAYGARPEGSASKLNTIRDGLRILGMIGLLVRDERPLQFFSVVAGMCWLGTAILGVPAVLDYFATGFVPRFPSLIVATGLAMIGIVAFAIGLILDTVSRARLEHRRLAYLAQPGTAEVQMARLRAKDGWRG